MRNSLNLITAVAIGLAGLTAALAQTYPSRPITMIIPFAAGDLSSLYRSRCSLQIKAQPIVIYSCALIAVDPHDSAVNCNRLAGRSSINSVGLQCFPTA